ncbi:hypothetical protein UL82_01960 [Corynebacterium kutscheri]|uniref:Uncharacterized protein n=1 Tax=Corynebacterium kutscheri TaxID=35755 RepID=A0A0F6QYJ8_9CORY|nr:hypothetical protein [Corynebacterium kutscheri]AKE40617.1 hypothetical protein UL82_01960 [Corynebacterium kutscheri]VEH11014.1 Uncharacterised protein [Corynebacterium kutscheri]
MSFISLNVKEAQEQLRAMLSEAEKQLQIHISSSPELTPSQCGRDFQEFGQKLNIYYRCHHERTTRRYEQLIAALRTGIRNVEELSEQDRDFARKLGEIS